MPRAWSSKDERMYEHIEESSEKRGVPADRAKEIAARTVNKHRREEGRTPNAKTQGTGNPNVPLDQRSKDELVNVAKSRGVKSPSKKNKSELVKEIRKH